MWEEEETRKYKTQCHEQPNILTTKDIATHTNPLIHNPGSVSVLHHIPKEERGSRFCEKDIRHERLHADVVNAMRTH